MSWENSSGYCVVMVTASSRSEAEAIAVTLVEEKLAACVSLVPIHSIYSWQGKVNFEDEYQLLIKTKLHHFDKLSEKIKTIHSYEVPEIMAVPIIAGSQTYLNWISETVGNE